MKALTVIPSEPSALVAHSDQEEYAIPSKLFIPKKELPQLRKHYEHIYQWHTEEGMDAAEDLLVDDEEVSSYFDWLANMKSAKQASLYDMILVSQAVRNGALSWSAEKLSHGESLAYWARQIYKLSDEHGAETKEAYRKKTGNKKASYQDAAYNFLLKHSLKLAYIHRLGLNEKNIGGLNVLMETSAHYNKGTIVNPKMLNFSEIEGANALVNLAIEGKVEVLDVFLGDGFTVHMTLKNLTAESLDYVIPRGQLFENATFECKYQNLTITQHHQGTLEPYEIKTSSYEAWCINASYNEPIGNLGRLTIYQSNLMNDHVKFVKELWKEMKEEIVFSDWKQSFRNAFNLNSTWHQLNKTKQKVVVGLGIVSLVVGGSFLFSALM